MKLQTVLLREISPPPLFTSSSFFRPRQLNREISLSPCLAGEVHLGAPRRKLGGLLALAVAPAVAAKSCHLRAHVCGVGICGMSARGAKRGDGIPRVAWQPTAANVVLHVPIRYRGTEHPQVRT